MAQSETQDQPNAISTAFQALVRTFMPEHLQGIKLGDHPVDIGKQNLQKIQGHIRSFIDLHFNNQDRSTYGLAVHVVIKSAEAISTTLGNLAFWHNNQYATPIFPLLRDADTFKAGDEVMTAVYLRVDNSVINIVPVGYVKCEVSQVTQISEYESLLTVKHLTPLSDAHFIPKNVGSKSSVVLSFADFEFLGKKESIPFKELWFKNSSNRTNVEMVLLSENESTATAQTV